MKTITAGHIVRWAILLVVCVVFIFPFYFIVVTAFKNGQDLTTNPIGLPVQLHLENFANVFAGTGVLRSIGNSILVSAGTIGVGLLVYVLCSFGIYSLKRSILATVVFSAILFGLMIPAVGYWQVILVYRKFLLYNSRLGVILGLVAGSLPFCSLLIVGHMRSIPGDLVDSGAIDGASDFQLLRHLVVPLSRPVLLAVTVFLLVESWNNLIMPLLLLRDDGLLTLPLKLKGEFFREYSPRYDLFFAGALVTSLPFIAAYMFLQKYFVYGLGGALKE